MSGQGKAVAVLLLALAAAEACTSDNDCSLNGVCGSCGPSRACCRCDASWSGPNCSSLNLQPAERQTGLQSVDDGKPSSSWGGVVTKLPGGGWGMIAAEMVDHCGIGSWTRNSRIVYATSTSPGGLYKRQAQIEGYFAHEPSLTRSPNGTWVMYFARHFPNSSASGGHHPCNCTNGSTVPGTCSQEVAHNGHVTFMATAASVAGPWSAPRMVSLLDCNLQYCQHDMVLAGTILPNGTFLGIVKVHGKASEAHLVVAEDWADTDGYKQSPNGESGNLFNASFHPPDGGRVEDPSEPWQDLRGNWHILFHAESPSGAPWERSGGHAYSLDGRHWTYTGTAYTTTVQFTDGTSEVFTRRERPHLIFGDDSKPHTPTHLTNGVVYGPSDACYTLIQPIVV